MQQTSALYKSIVAGEHWFEQKVVINEIEYDETKVFSIRISKPGVSEESVSIGGALAKTLELNIVDEGQTIPRMAEIQVYTRVNSITDGVSAPLTSEWLSKGVYYIDTRSHTDNRTIQITAYDAMLKTEQDYPSTEHAWPYADIDVVEEIATDIGVTVDPRTEQIMTAQIMVDLPTSYTEREVLENLACAYAGNFIITDDNTLLLVPLYGNEPDNITGYYLADTDGETALTFGDEGWFILV